LGYCAYPFVAVQLLRFQKRFRMDFTLPRILH